MTRKSKPPIAIYSALADATRCRIIEILLAGPIPVHKLADAFSISRPAISRHLRVLKTAGLVAEVKKGRENLYALRTRKLGPAITWIDAVLTQTAAETGAVDRDPSTFAHVAEVAPVQTEAPAESAVAPEPAAAPVQTVAAAVASLPETPAEPEPVKAKPKKSAKTESGLSPKPAANQMGFDF